MANLKRYRVFLDGLAGGPGVMTYVFSNFGADQDIPDAVEGFLDGAMALVKSTITFTGDAAVDVFDETSGQLQSSVGVTPFTLSGESTDNAMSPTTQGLIRWHTGVHFAGRELQGKTFFPYPTETLNDASGVPSSGYISGLAAQAQALVDADVGFCIWSRAHANHAIVNSVSVWNKWAVLRGRRDG